MSAWISGLIPGAARLAISSAASSLAVLARPRASATFFASAPSRFCSCSATSGAIVPSRRPRSSSAIATSTSSPSRR
jgi:hypothetical protein